MKKLSVGVIGTQIKLDPLAGYNYMDYLLVQCIYQTLVRVSEKGEILGNLAESWTISEDRKKFTFKIGSKALFSNGKKVTSDDVIFSLARHGWPDSKSIIKGYLVDHIRGFKNLKMNQIPDGIKKISQDTFEISLEKPYIPFLYVLTMPGFSVVPRDIDAAVAPVGSGPLTAENTSGKWIFKANLSYSGSAPNMKSIALTTFASAEEAKLALSKSEVDVLLNLPFSRENQSALPSGYHFLPTESLSYQHFFVNSKKNIPKKTRQALGQLIHHIAQTSTVEKEFFQPISTLMPAGVLPQSYYEREIPKSDEVVLIDALSKLKEVVRIIFPRARTSESFMAALKTRVKEITKKINIEELDLPVFRKRLSEGDYEISLFAYIGNYPDPDGFLDSIRENNLPGVHLDSEDLFKEIEGFRFDGTPAERALKYEKALRNFEDQWNLIPAFQMRIPFVVSKKIKLPKTKYRYEAELWNFLWENP